jgi:hypothetical protein
VALAASFAARTLAMLFGLSMRAGLSHTAWLLNKRILALRTI